MRNENIKIILKRFSSYYHRIADDNNRKGKPIEQKTDLSDSISRIFRFIFTAPNAEYEKKNKKKLQQNVFN